MPLSNTVVVIEDNALILKQVTPMYSGAKQDDACNIIGPGKKSMFGCDRENKHEKMLIVVEVKVAATEVSLLFFSTFVCLKMIKIKVRKRKKTAVI